MMRKQVTDKNYDLIFKLAASVFKGRILDFLGIDCAGIARVSYGIAATGSEHHAYRFYV